MEFPRPKAAAKPAVVSLIVSLCLAIGSPDLAQAAQPRPGTAPEVDREAVAFVQNLLAQHPAKEMSIDGVFHIRHADGRRSQVPVRYLIRPDEPDWRSIYATEGTSSLGPERLVVTHHMDRPNEYQLTQVTRDGSRTNHLSLTGSEAALSFAGTDFWLTDLGLEFLHWPLQRMVRDANITMKWGRPMKVVESTNPRPTVGGYSRVVSWIDSELGSIVKAEAYDTRGKRFKVFELKSFKKVNGRWQVKDMEIRNDQDDTRTRLEFNFESD